jgi:CAAX prenyl protease-like protein
MFAWIAFRFVGSVITVPIAEELAFRGYLLPRLAGRQAVVEGPVPFTWMSFLLSSILFGAMHSSWTAGIIAGMGYAIVRYQSQNVRDAIAAHATTNLILFCYVMATAKWSLL